MIKIEAGDFKIELSVEEFIQLISMDDFSERMTVFAAKMQNKVNEANTPRGKN